MNQHLTAREKRTLHALAECIIPDGGTLPFSYRDIDYVFFAEDFMANVPKHIRWFVHFNLWVIQYFSWVYLKRPALFSSFSIQEKKFVLASFSNSKRYLIRGIFLITSSLLLLPMYKDERVMNAIGYFGYRQGTADNAGLNDC